MSGIHIESERSDDETMVHEARTSHAISYTRQRENAHDIRGNVGTVTWGQRIGPQGKVKNRGPRDLRM
jgi:hypothetical protein